MANGHSNEFTLPRAPHPPFSFEPFFPERFFTTSRRCVCNVSGSCVDISRALRVQSALFPHKRADYPTFCCTTVENVSAYEYGEIVSRSDRIIKLLGGENEH